MKKRDSFAVPVQKGAIDPNPKTMKTMTHTERLNERAEEMTKTRWGQRMDLQTPRKGKK